MVCYKDFITKFLHLSKIGGGGLLYCILLHMWNKIICYLILLNLAGYIYIYFLKDCSIRVYPFIMQASMLSGLLEINRLYG